MSCEPASSKMTSIRCIFLIRMVLCNAFLGGSNIDFIILKLLSRLQDSSTNPGTCTETSGLQEQSKTEEDVGEGAVEEGNWEGGSGQLPSNGSDDGSDDSRVEASVEELLGTIGNAKNILARSDFDVESGDTSNDKEAGDHAELTSNHESREVLTIALEEEVAGLLAKEGGSTFFCRELGDGEEGDLHSFQHTYNCHESNEEDKRDDFRDTLPHGCLALEECTNGHSKGEAQNGKGHDDAGPEEDESESLTGLLIGLDGLARDGGYDVLDEVRRVHHTREFNGHGGVEGEQGKVVVDEVDHTVRGVDLGGELADHGGEKNHGKTGAEEDFLDNLGKAKNLRATERGTAHVYHEHDHQHHELTAHQVTVEIVTLEGEGSILVGDGVAIFVEVWVNRWQTDQRGLLSFDH